MCDYYGLVWFVKRWHDAGTYDAESKTGGPNGSIRNEAEYSHGANSGLKIALDLCGEVLFYLLYMWIKDSILMLIDWLIEYYVLGIFIIWFLISL